VLVYRGAIPPQIFAPRFYEVGDIYILFIYSFEYHFKLHTCYNISVQIEVGDMIDLKEKEKLKAITL
jgi:hypothetical protein